MRGATAPAWAVPVLLALFALVVATAASTKSATYDEPVHILSGYRILTQGDFHTNHEHPPLMKILAAAPLLLMNVSPPTGQLRQETDQWSVSSEFVYRANDANRVLAAARLPITLLATCLAYAVFRSTATSLGPVAGLAALALLVTEPNILAHSGLVTTDLGITAMVFFTFQAFLVGLRRWSRGWMVGAGALFGLALLTKFTAVLLVPILAIAGGLVVWLEGTRRWTQLLAALAAVVGIGLAVLNAGYGFGGTFSSLRGFAPESESFRRYAAGPLGGVPLPLPIEYVRGFDHAEAGGQRWWAYLLGRHSMTGWRTYYLVAFAVKTPLPLLMMAGAGMFLWPALCKSGAAGDARRGDPPALRPAHALLPQVPLLVYLAAFTLSGNLKNIGLRYILPVYPFLCMLAALVTRMKIKRSWLLVLPFVWQAALAGWMYPDYLTFFNLTVGGPSRGAEVLLDSNLDWGQDLKGLGAYIRQNRVEKIYVDYFGRGSLRYYGINSTPDFEGGLIAVSATNLKGVYSENKQRYRFLWAREPVAVIGGSIFIYDAPRPADWVPKAGAD